MPKKKNTRADKAAAKSNKSSSRSGSTGKKKNSVKSPVEEPKKMPKVRTEYDSPIPASVIVSIISLLLFVIFVIICIKPEGKLLLAVLHLVTGLFGIAGFYFSIPALLYIFAINAFGRKTKSGGRSICAIAFVFCCGCLYHLVIQTKGLASGLELFADLYLSGINGNSGGVICGGLAVFLRWACGGTISYILVGIAAILTLLGAMQITVPSLIRAIVNRPRDTWEEEEQEEIDEELAAKVVNHIATKRIEQKQQKRKRQELLGQQSIYDLPAADEPVKEKKTKQIPEKTAVSKPNVPAPQKLIAENVAPVRAELSKTDSSKKSAGGTPSRAAGMMSTIDLEIGTPLFEKKNSQPSKADTGIIVEADDDFDIIPVKMPPLEEKIPSKPVKTSSAPAMVAEKVNLEKMPVEEDIAPKKISSKDAENSAKEVAKEIAKVNNAAPQTVYSFPPISLLKRPMGTTSDGSDEIRENSKRLNETLASFHIDAHIINVTRGPSVTRYEVELDKGVRLNKLTNCADDIALSLGASGVRIAAIPGKISIVGIEVPNQTVTMVSLREVIDSTEFKASKSHSSFSVGKDIGGSCIVGNISKMPHMLIAGTTGSGKSVCMNSIIISLLYKSGPEDIKLIMVDPKMVELGIYNGIPQLLIPVVTDPKKAAGSLQWAVTEMLRRYKMMSEMGVRDLESYNSIVTAEDGGKKLPSIVIIIDELADLMLVAAKEVEDSICRIAQMGRAAGMHLIIATQRPSADVITGLMKANIPSRIAFAVASAMESRIILDTQGAEKLVGKGDMLYAPIGTGKPLRVQGCFVTDQEVEAVATYVKEHYTSDYDQEVVNEIEKQASKTGTKDSKNSPSSAEPSSDELDGDEMLPAAVDVILETGQASVSMLQRRLKLGYARAARIVDEMEEKGIVGPFQGSKPRAILVTKEQWAGMRGGDTSSFSNEPVPEEID